MLEKSQLIMRHYKNQDQKTYLKIMVSYHSNINQYIRALMGINNR